MNQTKINGPGGRDFSVPLGTASSGRLRFARGAASVTLRVDSSTGYLYRARFDGPLPELHALDGTVTIRYPRTFHPFDWHKRAGEVTLNGSIPWQIEFHGGLSRLDADLSVLRLGSFEIIGGASGVAVTLPRPLGTVSVRVSGGASDVTIHVRPASPRGSAWAAAPASWLSTISTSVPSAVRCACRPPTTRARPTATT